MTTETLALDQLCEEIKDMNRSLVYHCNRCHTPLRSETYEVVEGRALIEYKAPNLCAICKDFEWDYPAEGKQAMPTAETGLLCRCNHPECGRIVYIKPNIYLQQQAIQTELRVFIPILIDTDKEKVSRLLGKYQNKQANKKTVKDQLVLTSK